MCKREIGLGGTEWGRYGESKDKNGGRGGGVYPWKHEKRAMGERGRFSLKLLESAGTK